MSRKNVVDHSQNCCCRGRGDIEACSSHFALDEVDLLQMRQTENKNACREMLSCTSNVSISWFSCLFWCLLDLSAATWTRALRVFHHAGYERWSSLTGMTRCCAARPSTRNNGAKIRWLHFRVTWWHGIWFGCLALLVCGVNVCLFQEGQKLLGHQSPEMCVVLYDPD